MNQPQPRLWRAWLTLLRLSFWRLGWTMQGLAAVTLVALLAIVVFLVTLFSNQSDQFHWNLVNFSRSVIDNVYLRFILPMLCLCFGTQALGGEWEEKNLVWLLTRPIPRPLIYLAKYLAALPWCLGLSLAGFFLVGFLVGVPGQRAVRVFWPVIVWGCFAYTALFLLLGSWFRRSTIIAITYCFVLETIFSNMPGLVKRVSLAFYTRCYFFGLAKEQGWHTLDGKPAISPDRINFFLPVDGDTARAVLATVTVSLVIVGMLLFARREYRDLT